MAGCNEHKTDGSEHVRILNMWETALKHSIMTNSERGLGLQQRDKKLQLEKTYGS
jgi:hypothetical protein